MRDVADALDEAVTAALARLQAIDETASLIATTGRWSRREILGHLVDSASNNHQRFVRAQLAPELVGPGYTQEEWVAVQGYAERPWSELVLLWTAMNRHLAHVIRRIPATAGENRCTIGAGAPVTLRFVAEDYVRHLQHHLRQILDPVAAAGGTHPPFAGPKGW